MMEEWTERQLEVALHWLVFHNQRTGGKQASAAPEPAKPMSVETEAAYAKMKWGAMLGVQMPIAKGLGLKSDQ